MLKLIEGGLFAGGHEQIKHRIGELVALSRRSLLIVPEQQTVNAEHEMTDFLPPSAPLFFEATNFTRLADTVFRSLGGLAGERANASKRSLIMWRTLSELAPVLETACKGEITTGIVEKMLSGVRQMQSFSIGADELARTADALDTSVDRRLVARIRDMSRVLALYKKLLHEQFTDSDDDLMNAADKIASSDLFKDTEIFIDGFTSFTEPQYRLISALIKKCRVTVTLTLPKAMPDAFEYSEIKEAEKRLIRIAAECGSDAERIRIDGRGEAGSMLIAEITDLLWRSNGKVTEEYLSDESLKIYEAENPYEECDFVAADIKRRVMNGAKYSDFGIIARSLGDYSGILGVSFSKAGLPLFISERSDIASFELIKLIYSAFSAIIGGYDRRDVISYSKCSLCGADRKEADEFELYSEKWQINGKRFTDGVIWNMNPCGYTPHRREGDEERLIRINNARRDIIGPLTAIEEQLNEAKTVREYLIALMGFLSSLDIENRLDEKSKKTALIKGGDVKELSRLWKQMCDALDGLCDTVGDMQVSTEAFLALLKITFSQISIGSIPAYNEQVSAMEASVARMYGKKYIYIIGTGAGVFPPPVDDDTYFSDRDKTVMKEAGLSICADSEMRSSRELFYFVRALSFAKREVTLLYPALNTAFKAQPPSVAIERIRELTGGKIAPIKLSDLPDTSRIFNAEYALEHLSNTEDKDALTHALKKAGYADKLKIRDSSISNTRVRLSSATADILYGKSIRMSPSRLEKYVKCPMSYFCHYDLKIDSEERVEFDGKNIGTFIHAILETFFSELKERGKKINEITDTEKQALIERVSENYVTECFDGIPKTSARLQNTVSKLCRAARPIIDGLCDEFSACEYEPVFFELAIDKNSDGAPMPIAFTTQNGREVFIHGVIDRVDTFRSGDDVYVRVIDYKSGNKIFSPKDLEEGLNLQMFLYLKSVVETDTPEFRTRIGLPDGGKMIPAGVIYVKTSLAEGAIKKNSAKDASDAVKAGQARLGMLLDDMTSISAMNPAYIPVKFKKDGAPDRYSVDKLYTAHGWEKLNETISDSVKQILNDMTNGIVDAAPKIRRGEKTTPCTWCKFKAICRSSHK